MLRRVSTLLTLILCLCAGTVLTAPAASAATAPSTPSHAATAGGPTPQDVEDEDVVGYAWTPLDRRTTEPRSPRATFTITYGNLLHGNDGCNDFWGHATVNGVTRRITFDVEGMTRRMCFQAPSLDVDRELVGTHRYYLYGDRLTLTRRHGLQRISFERA